MKAVACCYDERIGFSGVLHQPKGRVRRRRSLRNGDILPDYVQR